VGKSYEASYRRNLARPLSAEGGVMRVWLVILDSSLGANDRLHAASRLVVFPLGLVPAWALTAVKKDQSRSEPPIRVHTLLC
jgi:hypothetical protein